MALIDFFSASAAMPKFIIRPTAQSVDIQSDASFECHAIGSPRPTLFWSFEGNRSVVFPGTAVNEFNATSSVEGLSVLTVSNVVREHNGLIVTCVALNAVGSISARAKLSISSQDDRPPPIIIRGPVNQTLPIKSIARFECVAIGVPTPIISWYRDGIPLVASSRVNLTDSGQLTISDLNKDTDQGLYTCVASSRSGKSTWSGFLRLELPTNPNIKFYRSPEPNKMPAPPMKPQLVNTTDDTITISWSANIKAGVTTDVIGYSIEIFSNNISKSWIPIASKIQETVYTQRELTRGASYIFIVRAENSFGVSAPSPMSDPIKTGINDMLFDEDFALAEVQATLTTGDIVELLDANATDSMTVRLVWEILDAQYVEGFYIYSIRTDRIGDYKMLTVLHGGGASMCTVEGLEEFTEYEFFLIPFYKQIKGRPSNSRRAVTHEDGKFISLLCFFVCCLSITIYHNFSTVPSDPPSKMEATLLNATAVFLKWEPPSSDNINGILVGYQIIIRGIDAQNISRVLANMSVEATSPSLMLANLTTGISYSVSVAATTHAGIGVYSQPAVLRLDPNTNKLDQEFTRYMNRLNNQKTIGIDCMQSKLYSQLT